MDAESRERRAGRVVNVNAFLVFFVNTDELIRRRTIGADEREPLSRWIAARFRASVRDGLNALRLFVAVIDIDTPL